MPRSERCRIRGIALTLLLATLGGKRLRPAERVALIEPLPPEERLALVELPRVRRLIVFVEGSSPGRS